MVCKSFPRNGVAPAVPICINAEVARKCRARRVAQRRDAPAEETQTKTQNSICKSIVNFFFSICVIFPYPIR